MEDRNSPNGPVEKRCCRCRLWKLVSQIENPAATGKPAAVNAGPSCIFVGRCRKHAPLPGYVWVTREDDFCGDFEETDHANRKPAAIA